MRCTSRRYWRGALAVLSLLCILAYSAPGRAEDRAVALYMDGPDSGAVRGILIDALPAGAKIVDDALLRTELARQGLRTLGKEIDAASMTRIRKAARVIGVGTVVVARIRRDRTGHHVRLLVIDAWKAPAALADASIGLKSYSDDVDAVKAALGPSVGPEATPSPAPPPKDARPPEPPAPVSPPSPPAETPPAPLPPKEPPPSEVAPSSPTAAEPGTSEGTSPGRQLADSMLDVSIGDDVAGRHFRYSNGIAPATRVWSVPAAPGLSLRGAVFPFAWRDFGISAEYLRIYSLANTSGSLLDDLRPSSYSIAARVRIHPGRDPPVLLGLSVGYACTTFASVGPPDAELPNVTYRSVRPAIDARVPAGPFSLLASASLQVLVDPGDISTRFYGPSGLGFDAELGGALKIGSKLEMRLTGWYERYSLSFSPSPDARFSAGGAVDELYGGRLALGLVL